MWKKIMKVIFMSSRSPQRMQVFIESLPHNVVDFTIRKLERLAIGDSTLKITYDLLIQEYRYGYIAIVWCDGIPKRLSITKVGK